LWRFAARVRPPENGLFYLQGALYCAARFAIEFFRAHSGPPLALGLHAAQWACVAGFAFFATRLYLLLRPAAPRMLPHEAAR
jgi:prolipoprotein diacylglyceryltransferase